jgi:hypothetical protein
MFLLHFLRHLEGPVKRDQPFAQPVIELFPFHFIRLYMTGPLNERLKPCNTRARCPIVPLHVGVERQPALAARCFKVGKHSVQESACDKSHPHLPLLFFILKGPLVSCRNELAAVYENSFSYSL